LNRRQIGWHALSLRRAWFALKKPRPSQSVRACHPKMTHYRKFCPKCFSWDIEWRKCSGKGRLYTYSIQYRPQAPGFQNDVPYITAIVQLEEGPRLMTNLIDIEADPEKVKCDMPVEVVFEDVNEEISIPKFRPAR